MEILTLLAVIIYAGLTFWQAYLTRQLARISQEQADTAQTQYVSSQRAYVTIGRKDGVVADFVIPKHPKQNAEIVIYFQNTGHLPAKFVWGTLAPFLAKGSQKTTTGITYTHPFKEPLNRTRDKKTGSIGEHGESSIIAGDSVFISTVGEISQKDLADLPAKNMGLLILGEFEYCDELRSHEMRQFGLRYRSNAPSSSLSFDLADESTFPLLPLPPLTDTTEYLFPCELASERKK